MKHRGAIGAAALLGAPGLVAATPLSSLRRLGPAADPSAAAGWGMGLLALAALFLIGVLLLSGALKSRRAAGEREPNGNRRQPNANRREAGTAWAGAGLAIGASMGFVAWILFAMVAVAMPQPAAELTLKVTGAQWWWAVDYADRQDAKAFVTANEIHIPVGKPVRLELGSADVAHSFGVPELVAQTDVIPGQTRVMWLQADRAGVYRGQCGQYCGAQHTHMSMRVVAEEPKDYAAWRRQQLEPARLPASEAAREGRAAFEAHCAACHAVRGTPAAGSLGPELTHLMSRETIAAGLLPNTPSNLAAWITSAQSLKPGSQMPSLALSTGDLQAVVSYLDTLR